MYCNGMFENIRFNPESISSCSNNVPGPFLDLTPYINHKSEENIKSAVYKYKNIVNNAYEQMCANKIPDDCNGCFMLMQKKENSGQFINDFKIKRIDIAHWYTCNINCSYCINVERKKRLPLYNVLDYIKILKKDISDNCIVYIGGGEPGILPEIDDILNFFYKFNNSFIFIMSNLVIWKSSYEKLLRNEKLGITTSLDSGNRELYKKIKQKDDFDCVIENIKKTLKYAKKKEYIVIKYIILENINDKREYFSEFLDLMISLGVEYVQITFDWNDYNIGRRIPEHILELYNYAKNLCFERNIILDKNDRTEEMCENGIYI